MRRSLRSLLTPLVYATAALSGTSWATDHRDSLTFEGQDRSYLIHVPDRQPPPGGFPLILAFHGGGMQGAGMARISQLNVAADRHGFIVVYPDGIDRHWNDGRSTIRQPQNDVGFVSTLLDEISHAQPVDPGRIYATGLSNGALFAERLACDLSARIAAIAPVAGTLPVDMNTHCHPARTIAVLQIDGTADPIMPYAGGAVKDFGGRGEGGQVMSVPATMAFWAAHNQCRQPGIPQPLPVTVPFDPTRITRIRYAGCPSTGPVTLLAVTGGGHVWPGGAQTARPRITGQPSRQIDASETIARFFLALPDRRTTSALHVRP